MAHVLENSFEEIDQAEVKVSKLRADLKRLEQAAKHKQTTVTLSDGETVVANDDIIVSKEKELLALEGKHFQDVKERLELGKQEVASNLSNDKAATNKKIRDLETEVALLESAVEQGLLKITLSPGKEFSYSEAKETLAEKQSELTELRNHQQSLASRTNPSVSKKEVRDVMERERAQRLDDKKQKELAAAKKVQEEQELLKKQQAEVAEKAALEQKKANQKEIDQLQREMGDLNARSIFGKLDDNEKKRLEEIKSHIAELSKPTEQKTAATAPAPTIEPAPEPANPAPTVEPTPRPVNTDNNSVIDAISAGFAPTTPRQACVVPEFIDITHERKTSFMAKLTRSRIGKALLLVGALVVGIFSVLRYHGHKDSEKNVQQGKKITQNLTKEQLGKLKNGDNPLVKLVPCNNESANKVPSAVSASTVPAEKPDSNKTAPTANTDKPVSGSETKANSSNPTAETSTEHLNSFSDKIIDAVRGGAGTLWDAITKALTKEYGSRPSNADVAQVKNDILAKTDVQQAIADKVPTNFLNLSDTRFKASFAHALDNYHDLYLAGSPTFHSFWKVAKNLLTDHSTDSTALQTAFEKLPTSEQAELRLAFMNLPALLGIIK